MKNNSNRKNDNGLVIGLCIGVGIGTALGVVFDNIAIGVAIGAGLGLVLGTLYDSKIKLCLLRLQQDACRYYDIIKILESKENFGYTENCFISLYGLY